MENKPHSAIGFTLLFNNSKNQLGKSQDALKRALSHFPDINKLDLDIGNTNLTIWGRGCIEDTTYRMPNGSILVLVGSPVGDYSWQDISKRILVSSTAKPFELPWEGRVILIKIDPTGKTWTIWNDWMGSIPIFHSILPAERIASTLEPIIVDSVGFNEDDIYLPSVLALLMWGHYMSDWTLFKHIKVVPPDSEATWDTSGFRYQKYFSVLQLEARQNSGWDDLIDEMHVLSKQAIAKVLRTHHQWILPLSGGLDSRLIAGVAADLGVNVYAYSWGSLKTSDSIHARSIARVLNIPWKNIDLGNSYLKSNRETWAGLFGSAMHFHGMYQMPFLDKLENEPSGPILSGFIGECLSGYDVKFLVETYTSQFPFQILPDGYLHWTASDLNKLMRFPIESALQELAKEYERQVQAIPGPLYHRLRLNVLWGRQRFFTYFQSMLSDYWRGVSTPYLDREYARFSYSLPRAVLDNRILQKATLRRYYPKLAVIPGTYASEPALLTGGYLLKKRLAKYIPQTISASIFPGLKMVRSNADVECVKHSGKESFYPLFDRLDLIKAWMNVDVIEEAYQRIILNNDRHAVRKMQSIQTLAYRL